MNELFDIFASQNTPAVGLNAGDIIAPAVNKPSDKPRVIRISSVQELRKTAGNWDDLWQRSEVSFPTMRAELLGQWIEHFAPRDDFQAVIVEHGGRWAAAMPLMRRKIAGLIDAGALPCNQWSSSGDCLIDPHADMNLIMPLFIDALIECGRSLLWLDEAILESSRWQAFMRAADEKQLKTVLRPRWHVGRVRINGHWDSYRATWSRKHRQHTAWSARKLAEEGEVRLMLLAHLKPEEAAEWMKKALELENLGWKGRTGGSVLCTPGMSDFFISQARQLAAWGQLELAFLMCGNKPIAFCYGQYAKGVFHSAKIGYDPRYARFSPGQLLRYLLLERMFNEPGRTAIDFLGPVTESHSHWRPETYTVARLAVALNASGRMALWAYERLRRGKKTR